MRRLFSRRGGKYRWTTIEGRNARGRYRSAPAKRNGNKPVFIAALLLVVAAACFGLYQLLKGPLSNVFVPRPTPTIMPSATPVPTPVPTPTPVITPRPGQDEDNALDFSQEASRIRFTNPGEMEQLNLPYVYGDELLFSAGKGSISSEMVLNTLYSYNFSDDTLNVIAKSSATNREIYETLQNERWYVWLDTDQQGSHRIFYVDREATTDEAKEPRQIKECKNALPKLRMYGNILIWTEQTDDMEDRLYEVDLSTGEDLSVAKLIGESTYGASAPSIYGNMVMWAGPDESYEGDSDLDLGSLIHTAYVDRALEPMDMYDTSMTEEEMMAILENMDPFETDTFKADMYVHEPVLNADAWAWVNANKDPFQTLYIKYGEEVRPVSRGVTAYVFADDFLVYAHSQSIWAYFYKTDEYARLSPEDQVAYAPTASGRRVVWIGPGDGSNDTYRTVVVPDRQP